ncbi:MAG: TrkH family potassium uptake protein [Saprospirales bacterium]|nr:TrkH family potassium uptake protein [Saprospirales bacterium]
MINFTPISSFVGILLILVGILMLTALPFSLNYPGGNWEAFVYSSAITITVGTILWLVKFKNDKSITKRDGYLIVTIGWFSMVAFGSLPYLIGGSIPSLTDAIFETASGVTTTGASILTDIESMPKDILFWRSLTQWIGGLGIIVLTVAIFPLLGFGGIELFSAESPGPTSDKIHPRIQETAKRLWLIYLGLTMLLTGLLWIMDMDFFDAINHAFTTMSTGGFSPQNESLAAYDIPRVQYTLILFMFLAGTNFTVLYLFVTAQFKKVAINDEFKYYLFFTLLFAGLITVLVLWNTDITGEKAFRDSLFQVVSLMTTTGYVSANYLEWGNAVLVLVIILLFLGGSAGSTAGGIKVIRHLVFMKNSFLEFKRILHPRAIVPLRLNGQIVRPQVMTHILVFLLIYLIMFIFGTFVLTVFGLDLETSIGAVATSLGNVGPGIGKVGPVDNFAWLPEGVKWVLSFFMLLGRLELFTILVLFTPFFWKSN